MEDVTELNRIEQESEIDRKTGLTPLQEQGAYLLASGKTITEVAQILSIARNTIYNWQDQPFFVGYCCRLRVEARERMNSNLVAMCDKAVMIVETLLNSKNEAIRFRVATYVIDNTSKLPIRAFISPRAYVCNELMKREKWEIDEQDIKDELALYGLE